MGEARIPEPGEKRARRLPLRAGKRPPFAAPHLAHNRIAVVAASNRLPTGLEVLDRRNRIAEIPGHWGALTQLRHLDLSQNRLEALPEALGQLLLTPPMEAGRQRPDPAAGVPGSPAGPRLTSLRNNQLRELPASAFPHAGSERPQPRGKSVAPPSSASRKPACAGCVQNGD